jgi:hypothetical protein
MRALPKGCTDGHLARILGTAHYRARPSSLSNEGRAQTREIRTSNQINCAMLWQLLTGWNGSEDAGALKVILGEPPL